jgi:uncharacterized membrane protein
MRTTAQVMMRRMVLHALATVIALWISLRMLTNTAMSVRMAVYACAWIACGAAYFLLLYCRQYILDAVDERIRCIVRDQRSLEEMRHYERRLRFIVRWHAERSRREK